jgi:WD40 repeat protein
VKRGNIELASIDVSSGQRQVISGPDWSFVGRISLLKDGDTLIFPAETVQSPIAGLFQYGIGKREGKRLTPEGVRYLSGYSVGGDVVSVRQDRRSSVSIVPANAPDAARIITPPAGHYDQVAWASGGSLIVNVPEGGHEELWRVSLDSTKQLLTDGPYRYNYLTGSPDGHSLAFSTNSAGGYGIWTMDNDTHDIREIAHAPLEVQSPTFTPDGWILFGRQADGRYQIWRVRKTGEDASPLMDMAARSPSVSPSGRYLVCRLLDERSEKWRVAVIDLHTLKVIGQYAKVPSGSRVKWAPDETALTYVREVNGVSNVWKASIANGSEAPLTKFKELKIFSFDWSPDGQNLGMVRGIDASDVILFKYSE